MNNEKSKKDGGKTLYTLSPLEDFKGLVGIDDRDDRLARFCLVTATFTIEQYCKRRLIRKKHFENIEYYGDLVLPLREYPVKEVLAAYVIANGEWGINNKFLETDFYRVVPDCGCGENLPFNLYLSPAVKNQFGITAIKVVYSAGYALGNVPSDLATACLELAAWNFNRYKGRRIGLTGNIRGAGKEGEHFEMV